MKPWEFWIDVGGTFTDCIARSPDDRLVECKVLSSGATKRRVGEILGPARFCDAAIGRDPAGVGPVGDDPGNERSLDAARGENRVDHDAGLCRYSADRQPGPAAAVRTGDQ